MIRIKKPEKLNVEYRHNIAFLTAPKEVFPYIIKEIRILSENSNGSMAKLGDLTFRVSNTLSRLARKPKSIEMPADAWAYLADRFADVLVGLETNPYYFNKSGYLIPPILFDLGILVTDMPVNGVG